MPARIGQAPIYQRKGSPYYWTWVYDGSRRVRISTKCTDRKAALAKAAELQRQNASPGSEHANRTVADALLAYCEAPSDRAEATTQAYRQRALNIAAIIGRVRLAQLGVQHLERYITERRAAKGTMRVELGVLRMALKYARRRGWPAPHSDDLDVSIPGDDSPRARWLPDIEIQALFAVLRGYRIDWLNIVLWTGARQQEVNRLTWDDIDLEAGSVRIRGTKSKTSKRVVPMPKAMREWLESRAVKTGPVVRRWINPHLTLVKACKRAKIEHCTAHDFRRTYASRLAQRGVHRDIVGRLLGHADGGKLASKVYMHFGWHNMQAAVDLL